VVVEGRCLEELLRMSGGFVPTSARRAANAVGNHCVCMVRRSVGCADSKLGLGISKSFDRRSLNGEGIATHSATIDHDADDR
jgi:hypothetical protein